MTKANRLIDLASRVINDYLTDATGEVYSIARGLGVVLFGVGMTVPMGVGVYQAFFVTPRPTMADWVSFLGALAVYYPALVGATVLLITGAAPTDPGNKWWDKRNGQVGPGHQPDKVDGEVIPPPDNP